MVSAKIVCPVCGIPLDFIPIEVGPTSIKYEVRCTGKHTDAELKAALASLGQVVK